METTPKTSKDMIEALAELFGEIREETRRCEPERLKDLTESLITIFVTIQMYR